VAGVIAKSSKVTCQHRARASAQKWGLTTSAVSRERRARASSQLVFFFFSCFRLLVTAERCVLMEWLCFARCSHESFRLGCSTNMLLLFVLFVAAALGAAPSVTAPRVAPKGFVGVIAQGAFSIMTLQEAGPGGLAVVTRFNHSVGTRFWCASKRGTGERRIGGSTFPTAGGSTFQLQMRATPTGTSLSRDGA
jgi:hypothetical protein